jgi:hypothetical protein
MYHEGNVSDSPRCPVHGVDVRKHGYQIDEGWKRCPVNPEKKNQHQGKCMFTRAARSRSPRGMTSHNARGR